MPRSARDDPFIYKSKTITAPAGFSVMNALITAGNKKVEITFYRRKKRWSRK